MAPPDPASVTTIRGASILNRAEIPMHRRGPPIGPNTSIKLVESIFQLVKRFSNLPAHLHAAEAITVENVRNSWFPMMAQLRIQFPDAFNENQVTITGHEHPIFQTLRDIWPERSQFDIQDRTIIIEFIIRSATEIGGRRTIRRNAARTTVINASMVNDNGERQPRPLDFDSIDDRENACRAYLFNKYSGHLHTLDNFYKNSTRAPTLPPIPDEMPESEQKRKMREPTEEPNSKKQKMTEESEDEELPEDETCQICYSKRRTHAFIHAIQPSSAHFICCESCANQCNYATSGCPLCRLPVVAVTKII
ncbi:unnamed protein product [Oikopleura dioica]|uniref:Uncharacterized protein n=1 Tax=Oikopleura dioica TaxID=34765 RepID=E4X775_OIKDI|nr:unnamed protein product [Oikopleura dioica]CBY41800.1 unnamed protein product [Oikopleura dioica]